MARYFRRRKFCRFCADKDLPLDYKRPDILRDFITERGKIMPRRMSGACAKHQRQLSTAIKRARTCPCCRTLIAISNRSRSINTTLRG